MVDYITLVVVGFFSGLGSATGTVVNKIFIEPRLKRLHKHTGKILEGRSMK